MLSTAMSRRPVCAACLMRRNRHGGYRPDDPPGGGVLPPFTRRPHARFSRKQFNATFVAIMKCSTPYEIAASSARSWEIEYLGAGPQESRAPKGPAGLTEYLPLFHGFRRNSGNVGRRAVVL